MNYLSDSQKKNHYKIALETYRLNYLANHEYNNFDSKTVELINDIEKTLNQKSKNKTILKQYLDNLDEKILIENYMDLKYTETDAKKIAKQIIKLNKNDYITRDLSPESYAINEDMEVSISKPFSSFRSCAYYFVDRLKQLKSLLDNSLALSKFPNIYKKFHTDISEIDDYKWHQFEDYLEEILRKENQKSGHLLMSTTSSCLEYRDPNDFDTVKNYEGFDIILNALSNFTKKKYNSKISLDTPYIEGINFIPYKIFLNQDVCLVFNQQGKVKNLMEYYSNVNREHKTKAKKTNKKV